MREPTGLDPEGMGEDALRDLHRAAQGAVAAVPTLDDSTWRDLDLPDLVSAWSRTASPLGQLTLYGWLRAPHAEPSAAARLEDRRRLLIGLGEEPSREWAAAILASLPRLPVVLLDALAGRATLPSLGNAPRVLVGLALLATASLAVSIGFGVAAIAVMFLVNFLFRVRAERTLGSAMASLTFVEGALARARALTRLGVGPALQPRQRRLESLLRELRPLVRALGVITFPAVFDQFPGEYLRLFLLNDERRLSRSVQLIRDHRERLCELLTLLGEWEAGLACAEAFTSGAWCEAELIEPVITLQAAKLRHPLLGERAVASDLTLEGAMVITGSNMSGKSTFLRAVALNAVLAQSLGRACAERWRSPWLHVASSLRNDDRLLAGESYYLAEAIRLRAILESSRGSRRLLAVIDEPFRGTNTSERIAAASAVTRALCRAGALTLVATHDREVGSLLANEIVEGHFEDECTGDGLRFDYVLRPGRATSTNAIQLLRTLGYPPGVAEDASAFVATLQRPG